MTTRPSLFSLVERDVDIFEAVYQHRFLTFALLLELFPPDPDKTPAHLRTDAPRRPGTNLARRLLKLTQHGYLTRLRAARSGEYVYALAPGGANVLLRHQPSLPLLDTDWREKNRTLSEQYIDHSLITARFRVALTRALAATPSTRLDRFERESRRYGRQVLQASWQHAGARATVNPDAFFILRDHARPEGRQRSAFFLESDRSTMTGRNRAGILKMADKYERYSDMYTDRIHQERYRIPSFTVLTVTKSRDRARNLAHVVRDGSRVPEGHWPLFYFTSEENYGAHATNVLAAIWQPADDPAHPRAIVPSPLPRR